MSLADSCLNNLPVCNWRYIKIKNAHASYLQSILSYPVPGKPNYKNQTNYISQKTNRVGNFPPYLNVYNLNQDNPSIKRIIVQTCKSRFRLRQYYRHLGSVRKRDRCSLMAGICPGIRSEIYCARFIVGCQRIHNNSGFSPFTAKGKYQWRRTGYAYVNSCAGRIHHCART